MSLIIATGNLALQARKASEQLPEDLRIRVNQWQPGISREPPQLGSQDTKILLPNEESSLFRVDTGRHSWNKHDTTVKLFFAPNTTPPQRIESVAEALSNIRPSLPDGLPITTLVLSLPEIVYSQDNDEQTGQPPLPLDPEVDDTYREAVKVAQSYGVQSFGVCEFSAPRLHALLDHLNGAPKPEINQINLRNCCALPPSLIKLARDNDIQLTSHNDPQIILHSKDIASIIQPLDWPGVYTWKWAVQLTTIIRDREIVERSSWIVKIHRIE